MPPPIRTGDGPTSHEKAYLAALDKLTLPAIAPEVIASDESAAERYLRQTQEKSEYGHVPSAETTTRYASAARKLCEFIEESFPDIDPVGYIQSADAGAIDDWIKEFCKDKTKSYRYAVISGVRLLRGEPTEKYRRHTLAEGDQYLIKLLKDSPPWLFKPGSIKDYQSRLRALSEKLKNSNDGPRSLKELLELGDKLDATLNRFKEGADKIPGIRDAVNALAASARKSQTARGG
jgi:hypothetical protein